MNLRNLSPRAQAQTAIAAVLALGTTMAHAALDTAVTTALDGATTDVGLIGKAVFVIALGIVLYKWFKRAL